MFSLTKGPLARFKKDDSRLITTTGPSGGTTMAGTNGCWTLPTIDNAARRESSEELTALPACLTNPRTTPLKFVRSSPVSELSQEHETRHSLGPVAVQQDSSLACEQPPRAYMSSESAGRR